jgi:hypothetical protein
MLWDAGLIVSFAVLSPGGDFHLQPENVSKQCSGHPLQDIDSNRVFYGLIAPLAANWPVKQNITASTSIQAKNYSKTTS